MQEKRQFADTERLLQTIDQYVMMDGVEGS